ncbi:MAG: TIGR01777 family protein [Anaerolineaceae bacterium]|nr:TIGR01777 family protein [Anaerolineaceae bacterium]
MRYLVIGGTGLIGTRLVEHLIAAEDEVFVLTRSSSSVLPKGAHRVQWDGKTTAGWADLVEKMDGMINLAGENLGASRWTEERKKAIIESRSFASQAVVSAIQNAVHKPEVLIQSSAVGYYGTLSPAALDEKDLPGSDFLAKICVDWEKVTEPVELLGVRHIVIRSGVVLAAEGGALSRMLLPFRFFVGGPLGSGKQWLSWIHLEDEVRAIVFLLKQDTLSGVFNLTSPKPVTNAGFGKTLASILHTPYWLPVPAFALKLLLGEMSTMVLDGQCVIPERLHLAGFQFEFPELEAALRNILKK